MNGKNSKKIRKEVKGVYVKAQSVLFDEIAKMGFGERLRFALQILLGRLK